MEPTRSSLYVPGDRESWIETADEHGVEVVVLDLGDSVPPPEKDAAREAVADAVPELRVGASASRSG